YEPPMLLNLLKNEKVTFSHCVPTILHMLLSSPAIKEVDLNGWKVIIGGSLLPKALCKAAMGLGIDIFAGYGMSETCPILTLAQLGPEMTGLGIDEEVAIRCKTGKPIPLVDLRIVDPEMRDTDSDAGATGEIVVRAPWLTQGYLKDPEGSKQLWAGGYLHTSDVASRDEKGYVQISDRIKDVIKTGGEWVSSLALEDIIAQHPSVGETAVIGRPDDKWGERPMALIVAKPGATVSEEEIRAHVKDYASRGVISKFGVPEKILFVTAIEKTSVGKLDKKLLRQKYAQ
ncbi:fatty acid--CoA ligase, partial [bacterium]